MKFKAQNSNIKFKFCQLCRLPLYPRRSEKINPSTFSGLKPGVCSGLILSGAFAHVIKDGGLVPSKYQFDLTNRIDPNRMKFVTDASCSEILIIPPCPPLCKGEGVKKSGTCLKRKGRVDWRSFRAQPLEIEPLCRKFI